jgi:VHL beta domain
MGYLRFSLAVVLLAACAPSKERPSPSESSKPAASAPTGSVRLAEGDPKIKAGYRSYRLRGFDVLLNEHAAGHPEEAQAVLTRVDESLADAVERFGPQRTALLSKVRIWIEWGDPSKGPRGPAEFHQSRDWLAQHGYDVEKEHGIEINDTRVFLKATVTQQPFALLHEFAHAYDALAFQNANPAITAAYRAALASGRYDAVPRIGDSAIGRAYALTDEREYFAETTEAYLAINDFYPFVREDLELADPIGVALMMQIWGAQPKRAALPLTRCDAARSTVEGLPTVIVFRNAGSKPVDVSWLDSDGVRKPMRQLAPGAVQAQTTYVGHVFEIVAGQHCIGLARATPGVVEVPLK